MGWTQYLKQKTSQYRSQCNLTPPQTLVSRLNIMMNQHLSSIKRQHYILHEGLLPGCCIIKLHYFKSCVTLPNKLTTEGRYPVAPRSLPLISTSCSSDKGWPFIGSVPFSAMYFSISLRSNTWLDTGETHGCSGPSLETMIE